MNKDLIFEKQEQLKAIIHEVIWQYCYGNGNTDALFNYKDIDDATNEIVELYFQSDRDSEGESAEEFLIAYRNNRIKNQPMIDLDNPIGGGWPGWWEDEDVAKMMEECVQFKQKEPDKITEEVCPDCGGDGIMTCNNPDHGFIDGVGGELGRLGCPGCGHDPNHKMRNTPCETCKGIGRIKLPSRPAPESMKTWKYLKNVSTIRRFENKFLSDK